ncbi:hypothetical protein [Vibrio cyclitrophicus]|uniref:hypothetical protein n=1 Tax=Vibrio cyclitrophicus TaxID=47951 RepID=UPI0032E36C93
MQNTKAAKSISNTSYGTISTCIRDAQSEHSLWVGLNSSRYLVIETIRSQCISFALTQNKTNWVDVWEDFIAHELEQLGQRLGEVLTHDALNLGSIPDDVSFIIPSEISDIECEYFVPFSAFEKLLDKKDFIKVTNGFNKHYGVLHV